MSFGDSAMQGSLGGLGDMIGVAAGPISEDCLYLNVWTPGLDAGHRDGQHLARRGDVVVVTVNYRLGAFDFLHAPELGATGNEALLDQIAACAGCARRSANSVVIRNGSRCLVRVLEASI